MVINIMYAPATYSRQGMVGTGVVLLLFMVGLGYKIYMGRNWARLLFAALLVAGLMSVLVWDGSGVHHPVVGYLWWVQAALQSACALLLFRKDARQWFAGLA